MCVFYLLAKKVKNTFSLEFNDPFKKYSNYKNNPFSVNPNDFKKSKSVPSTPNIDWILEPPSVTKEKERKKKEQDDYVTKGGDLIASGDFLGLANLKAPDMSVKGMWGVEFEQSKDNAVSIKNIFAPNMQNTSKQDQKTVSTLFEMAMTDNYANPNFATGGATSPYGVYGITALKKAQEAGDKETADALAQSLGVSAGASDARLKQISISRATATAQYWGSGDGSNLLGQANSILRQLGQKQIEVQVIRRRRGRYTTQLTGNPTGVVNAYLEKKALTDWAGKYGLTIDPNKEFTIQTGINYETVRYSNTIHNGRVVYGSYIKETPIMKTVKFSETPDAVRVNLLYGELQKQASVKKEKYLQLFDPIQDDSPYADLNYYSIPDEELTQAQDYKNTLIGAIKEADKVNYDLQNALSLSPLSDSPSLADDNSPKQRYLAYLNDPESDLGKQAKAEIDPIVQSLESRKVKSLDIFEPTIVSKNRADALAPLQQGLDELNKQYAEALKTKDANKTSTLIEPAKIVGYNTVAREAQLSATRWKTYYDQVPIYSEPVYQYDYKDEDVEKVQELESLIKQKQTEIQQTDAPYVQRLEELKTEYSQSEETRLNNAISFIRGTSKDFVIDGNVVATRDNLGRITVTDEENYKKYILETPEAYTQKEKDYESLRIAGLESEFDQELTENKLTLEEADRFEKEELRKAQEKQKQAEYLAKQKARYFQTTGTRRAYVRTAINPMSRR